jgi:hypothetical protein
MKDVEILRVYSEIQLNMSLYNPENEIWSISRDQGDRWYRARIPVEYAQNFRIIFEAIVGKSEKSDVVMRIYFM